MSQPPRTPESQRGPGDAWHVVGYLVTGVGMYATAGWLLDQWLDTSFLLPVGVVVGALLGTYLIYVRFRAPDDQD
ncbi:MAG: AtpZ/AtpI family protein [Kribbellaceae bacterium]